MSLTSKYPEISIFGDCAIHYACRDIKHSSAIGLLSWLSITSKPTNKFNKVTKEIVESSKFSNYRKRVYYYNFRKGLLEWLFSNRGEYLVFDCNDCRKNITLERDSDDFSVITSFGSDNKYFFDCINEDITTFIELAPYEIDFRLVEDSVIQVCDQIKKFYSLDKIIFVRHRSVDKFYDNSQEMKSGFFSYPLWMRSQTSLNPKIRNFLNKVESLVINCLPGIHVIPFPDKTLGVSKHEFGLYPLHYDDLYYEYLNKAIKLVFRKSSDEEYLLNNLCELYNCKFELLRRELDLKFFEKRVDEKFDLYQKYFIDSSLLLLGLKSIKDFCNYLDFLKLCQNKIIVLISVKDTCGFYERCPELDKLISLGFKNYPNKLQMVYIGVSLNSIITLDCPGGVGTNSEVLDYTFKSGLLSVTLHSSPFRKGNLSKIIVNGTDYSLNFRGINIVVIDSSSLKVIDSVSYDSHLNQNFIRGGDVLIYK